MLVAIYLLVRLEHKLDALTAAITRLEQSIAICLHQPEIDAKVGTAEITH